MEYIRVTTMLGVMVLFVIIGLYEIHHCKHDWKLVKKGEVDYLSDDNVESTDYIEIYQCSKCKKFKKVKVNIG